MDLKATLCASPGFAHKSLGILLVPTYFTFYRRPESTGHWRLTVIRVLLTRQVRKVLSTLGCSRSYTAAKCRELNHRVAAIGVARPGQCLRLDISAVSSWNMCDFDGRRINKSRANWTMRTPSGDSAALPSVTVDSLCLPTVSAGVGL